MRSKKITAVFFIWALALQLLPIKQAIRYFFTDSPLIEEFVASGKGVTKNFRLLEEDLNSMHSCNSIEFHLTPLRKSSSFIFAEKLPASYTADILTPPPNLVF